MPGTASTNSLVWSMNGGISSVISSATGDPAEQRDQRADRPRQPAALEARGGRGQRDGEDDRDQDRQQQRDELAEQQPEQQQAAAQQDGSVRDVRAVFLRHYAAKGTRATRGPPELGSGAALEVGDVLRLLLDTVLRLGELLLLLALALLAAALGPQRRVVREVARRLLGSAS